jgi:hypothetical protein
MRYYGAIATGDPTFPAPFFASASLVVLVLSLVPSYYEIGIKVAHVLDKAGGIVTALTTIAMAIFTFTLKRATDKLSDAGKRQIGIAAQMAELARQQVAIAGSQTDIQIKQHAVGKKVGFSLVERLEFRVARSSFSGGSTMARHLFFAITLIGTGMLLNSPAEAVTDARCEDQAANCVGRCANPTGGANQNKCMRSCDRLVTRCLIRADNTARRW